jgi:protein-S-isoprenylcysteine O-methyltransferase Ste14
MKVPLQGLWNSSNYSCRFLFSPLDTLFMMLFRALLAFIALPGIFAGLIPAQIVMYDPYRGSGYLIGSLSVLFGLAVLSFCVRDFLVIGRGTLAPWDPPKHLVILGLYRYSRNPMYVAIISILTGWALIGGSPLLAAYRIFMATVFYLRVVYGEELDLAKQFGDEWIDYTKKVPRWLPQISFKNHSPK